MLHCIFKQSLLWGYGDDNVCGKSAGGKTEPPTNPYKRWKKSPFLVEGLREYVTALSERVETPSKRRTTAGTRCGKSKALIALPPEFWAEVDKVGFNILVIKIYTCSELTKMKGNVCYIWVWACVMMLQIHFWTVFQMTHKGACVNEAIIRIKIEQYR